MKITVIEATDIQDAWFQCIRAILENGFKYEIQQGSYVGQTRLEFDQIVVSIEYPYAEPYDRMLPQIPVGLGIPNPVANGYVEQYLPYLMTNNIEPGEQYTYGSRIYEQIYHFINLLKVTPNTNQAILQVGQPSDCELEDPPCVVESTKILTINGQKLCQNIKVGDRVLTHSNNWKTVTKVYKRKYKGKVNEITLKGVKNKIKVTPEHLIYTVQIHKCPYDNKLNCKTTCKKQHSVYKKNGSNCPELYSDYQPEWTAAADLDSQSFVRVPVIKPQIHSLMSVDKMFLFGLWLAEGDYVKKDGIRFNLGQHKKGEQAHTEIKRIMYDTFNLSGGKVTRENNCIRQSFYSRTLCTYFYKMFNKYARYKTIPFEFIFNKPEALQALIDGYVLGDGYSRERGKNMQTGLYTTSENLKDFFVTALLSLGFIPSVTITKPKDGTIDGRTIKSNGPGYSISFTVNRKRSAVSYFDNGYCYIPVLSNKTTAYNGDVYNYEVSDDNSYVAELFPVHNCLRHIDMRVKGGQLIFYPYFRSWDLWGGFPANLAGIAVLQHTMAHQIGVEPGPICASSKGLHIYGYVEELAKLRCGV